jgi:two-component system, OmpR family, sensor kinase
MGVVISTLLDIARDGTTSGREQCRVADVVPALVAAAAGRLTVVDRTGGSTATVAAPAGLVVRALSPLVDNACRHGREQVVLEAVDHHDRVEVVVRDDGDGVDEAARATLFEPGVSHREGGGGLGLGIAQRMARSFGGEVVLADRTADERADEPGGAAFVVRLPRR